MPQAEDRLVRRVFGWEVMVGREGIEPPQSETADLQSAELTTCSTCPQIAAGAWCVADGSSWYQTGAPASNPRGIIGSDQAEPGQIFAR